MLTQQLGVGIQASATRLCGGELIVLNRNLQPLFIKELVEDIRGVKVTDKGIYVLSDKVTEEGGVTKKQPHLRRYDEDGEVLFDKRLDSSFHSIITSNSGSYVALESKKEVLILDEKGKQLNKLPPYFLGFQGDNIMRYDTKRTYNSVNTKVLGTDISGKAEWMIELNSDPGNFYASNDGQYLLILV